MARARTGQAVATAEEGAPDDGAARNEVLLVGRVAAEAQERELPSGDVLVTWRLVVDRPPSARPAVEGARVPLVDTFDCAAWQPGLRRTALRLAAGDVVSVQGALRRRSWRGATGPVSRYEVEVAGLKRLRKV